MSLLKNIDMILRSDAVEKHGGDSFQVDQYKKYLEQEGYNVRYVPFHVSMRPRPDSIIHIVNVDRPFDFLWSVRKAGNRPVIVSSIHHDLSAVRLMRIAERNEGLRSIAGRILPESAREFLAFGVRNFRKIECLADAKNWLGTVLSSVSSLPKVWQLVGEALGETNTVALLAEGERRALMRDTAWHGNNGLLIPNGAPAAVPNADQGQSGDWADRPIDVCVVGRIEPRKRQLETAMAAGKHGVAITFVGQGSPSSPRYVKEFELAVSANSNLHWAGALDHEGVLQLMRKSRVMLNASWVEVQSLVDIEGASAGCWVVVGRGGNSPEWLPDSVIFVDSHNVDLILSAVANVLKSQIGPRSSKYKYTWKMAADQLKQVYAEAK
jgi:glycosyltransferase involved in cell wall biosynthesis